VLAVLARYQISKCHQSVFTNRARAWCACPWGAILGCPCCSCAGSGSLAHPLCLGAAPCSPLLGCCGERAAPQAGCSAAGWSLGCVRKRNSLVPLSLLTGDSGVVRSEKVSGRAMYGSMFSNPSCTASCSGYCIYGSLSGPLPHPCEYFFPRDAFRREREISTGQPAKGAKLGRRMVIFRVSHSW